MGFDEKALCIQVLQALSSISHQGTLHSNQTRFFHAPTLPDNPEAFSPQGGMKIRLN